MNLPYLKIKLQKAKSYFLLSLCSGILFSCATRIQNVAPITPEIASDLMLRETGNSPSQRKLFHTYEEVYDYTDYSRKNTLSLSKIEGNYVEGVLISSGTGGNETFQVFGRFSFDKLYLYTEGPSTFNIYTTFPYSIAIENQEIFVFQIGQNGRILRRLKYAYKMENGTIAWKPEPQYNVDLDDRKKYTSIFSSTGFISKTDNYIGEEGKMSAKAPRTLEQKLTEIKSLLDKGIITKTEYDVARKQILSN